MLTVLFTDLLGSTAMYREMGDAPAFGKVMSHFDVLRDAIAEEDGALVKTIGDAVMAVFKQPVAAVRAILKAQALLADERRKTKDESQESSTNVPASFVFRPSSFVEAPMLLKAGIHTGPCIAVTLNDRLDYFGSTVNIASRLEGLSSGSDLIISGAVHADPEVSALLGEHNFDGKSEQFEAVLRGFGAERFELWRIAKNCIIEESELDKEHFDLVHSGHPEIPQK
jgi:class 3 adenylate cyclase